MKQLSLTLQHHGHDLTQIPNHNLEREVEKADFVFFLAFDVGGSRYLKKYQHTFQFIDNNARLMGEHIWLPGEMEETICLCILSDE